MIHLQEMLKNFLIVCVIIAGRNVYIQVHVAAKYFAVRAKDEYLYVGQTCSIESEGGFGGKKS